VVADRNTSSLEGALIGDRYKLGPLLGRGGQGSTYSALDIDLERRVAVKVFDLSSASSWKDLELFRRECAALRGLDHPGVPDYLEEIESDDGTCAYLVMELVPGRSLKRRVQEDGPLTEDELWDILCQVLEILAYLQERRPPIIHRDVKPANLLERPDGRLVLIDFGGVRLRWRADGGSTVVGTMGYMAPEQLYGDAMPATDIYGLGNTLVALASGQEPETLPRRGLRIDIRRALSVSDELESLLDRMTATDPEDRPAGAAELLDEIATSPASGDEPAPDNAPEQITSLPELEHELDRPASLVSSASANRNDDVSGSPAQSGITVGQAFKTGSPMVALLGVFALAGVVPAIKAGLLAFIFLVLPIVIPVFFGARWLLSPKRMRSRLRTPGLRHVKLRQLGSDRSSGQGADPPNARGIRQTISRLRRPRAMRHDVVHQQRHRNRRG